MAFDWSALPLRNILQRSHDAMSKKQREAVGHAKPGHAIDDIWMGLGKTFIGLTVGVIHKPQCWLIIGSKSSMNVWRQELKKWYPELASDDLYTIVRGQKPQRDRLWLQAKRRDGLFYATTFGSLIRDIGFLTANNITFNVITIDEPQKGGLRNRKTAGYRAVKTLEATSDCIWMGSGSLTTKGVPQLWSYLNIVNRKKFSSYWQFMKTFMFSVKGPFGTEFIRPINQELLAQVTAPYIFRVDEMEAQKELPPLRRAKLPAELTPKLAELYYTMSQELFMAFEGIDNESKFLAVANPLASFTKLRQLITCPAIIDPSLGPGVAIEAVVDKIQEYDGPEGIHNIIFTPYVKSIPIFKDYLSRELNIKPEKIITLQGGAEPEEIQAAEVKFRTEPDTLGLISLKYAESFNFETGMNAYFPHFDWDQTANEQAEARLRRRTSDTSRTIMSYYVDIVGTITDIMFDVLNGKVRTQRWTYQEFDRVRQSLTNKITGAED